MCTSSILTLESRPQGCPRKRQGIAESSRGLVQNEIFKDLLNFECYDSLILSYQYRWHPMAWFQICFEPAMAFPRSTLLACFSVKPTSGLIKGKWIRLRAASHHILEKHHKKTINITTQCHTNVCSSTSEFPVNVISSYFDLLNRSHAVGACCYLQHTAIKTQRAGHPWRNVTLCNWWRGSNSEALSDLINPNHESLAVHDPVKHVTEATSHFRCLPAVWFSLKV